MIELGMPVVSRDGRRIGRVERIIDRNADLPPGVVVAMPRVFGLLRRHVVLTTFDVRDIRSGSLVLRISRWDANNRAARAVRNIVRVVEEASSGTLVPASAS